MFIFHRFIDIYKAVYRILPQIAYDTIICIYLFQDYTIVNLFYEPYFISKNNIQIMLTNGYKWLKDTRDIINQNNFLICTKYFQKML